MRINTAKEKMTQGEPAFGFSLGLGSPLAAELLSDCGIDFLLLDTQHGSWGPDSTIAALATLAAGSAVPMARVAANEYVRIGRLLDEGVLGIVVPMVDSAEEARAVADACRFPPRGRRSWGWGRARVYGHDYAGWIDDQLFVAVQIESMEAVENAEAIMAVDGIDGCWVGPSDLALSLGFPPQEMHRRDEHARALERVVQACRATGKIPGIAGTSLQDARRRAGQGFQFVTAGGDAGFLVDGAAAALAVLRSR